MKIDDKQIENHTVMTFEVEDIEEEMRELRNKGIKFENYDEPEFKTVNEICSIGDDKSAWFKIQKGIFYVFIKKEKKTVNLNRQPEKVVSLIFSPTLFFFYKS